VIKIIDQGRGIEDVRRARQPFFTTCREEDRSGMGFTVMESFMDDVEVQSAPGKGTTVIMTKRMRMRDDAIPHEA
jgi:stage II sporulation protein AB (anti-sigma F factor)